MPAPINRRDFLKLTGLFPMGLAAPRLLQLLSAMGSAQAQGRNVIVVVFDAFSALDISLYGFERQTTPNLARLAERAVVYHNHYAGCNYTTSGTASLLTGTLPWTHRALRPKDLVAPPFVTRSLFGAFQDYYRIAYTHNGWANILLEQAQSELSELVPWKKLFLGSYDSFIHSLFANDDDTATVSWTRNVDIKEYGFAYSLFLSHLYDPLQERQHAQLLKLFPRGLPSTGDVGSQFVLETATEWIGERVARLPRPFIGYFHLLPPHGPYNTTLEFYDRFKKDGFHPQPKPEDVFSEGTSYDLLQKRRTEYDEFILYVDHEFGRFYAELESAGLLENTWVVLTSDHGEMFERGISAHSTDALYQPVIRIPLMIWEPGRQSRMDIQDPTSAVDVLPTLAHVTGHPLPDWTEGVVLPPYSDAAYAPDRSIYVVRAARNPPTERLSRASISLVKGRYKLLDFFGYEDKGFQELVKLFDLQADPEEMNDLSLALPDVTSGMLAELKARLSQSDKPLI